MPQPVASATKQNLLMAVAITVHIAKLNSVHAVEEEYLYGQTRYGVMESLRLFVPLLHHPHLRKLFLLSNLNLSFCKPTSASLFRNSCQLAFVSTTMDNFL
uniref:Uncharacterized protein n=1 Tax=Apteryx owenii TaxID=8824 RepID=A0A8B9NPZ7_APTOW